jgi:diacylglycerol kinase (ATP)
LDLSQWSLIAIAIGLVWAAELFNTAIESLADAITIDEHPLIRNAKDVSASAVLVASLTAGILGILVLLQQLKLL